MSPDHRVPTRDDHDRFCRSEGWVLVRDSRGKQVRHHVTYEMTMPDGRILRTRVSRPVDRTDYGPAMWGHILRDQLEVSEAEFWACADDKTLPDRGAPPTQPEGLPADLVHLLVNRVGLSAAEVAGMTRDDALARLNRFWSTGT